jgi:Nucleotidyl transferase AbiEii toxin, Type IV TA system
MTKREFARRVWNGKEDVLEGFLVSLDKAKIKFCVIGGLAVNAYTEPVVSLDLDIVVPSIRVPKLISVLPRAAKTKRFAHSLNIEFPGSDIRIQVQTDERYEPFLRRARKKSVLGYEMPVAHIEDVLQGKIWAASDESRRASKRQKDLADILRLIESRKNLAALVPAALKKKMLS